MDFKELMNLASQNKSRGKKQDTQEVTAKNTDDKSNKSGVSDTAIKAFLAKKELEKKRKAAEEEAARRARIEDRLAQSLGTKKKESAKSTTCSQTSADKRKEPSNASISAEEQLDRKNDKQNEHRAIKTPRQSSSKKPEKDRTRQYLEPVNKNDEPNSKKSAEKAQKGQRNAKKGPAMDFKALLAMAERNKNGGPKLPTVVEHGRSTKQEGSKEGERLVKKSGKSSEQRKSVNTEQAKSVKDEKTNGQMHSKGSSKLKDKGIPSGEMFSKASSKLKDKEIPSGKDKGSSKLKDKGITSKTFPSKEERSVKQDLKRPGLVNGGRETKRDSKTSSSVAPSSSNSKAIHPGNDRRPMKEGHLAKRRDRDTLKRKRNPFEDEMDDFIDDGDGEEVDVSKYIKEIFGYDRKRFRDDDDDDLAGMESNYSQIEREESKSSNIARLEDEIEQLKELHELKKQRDQLKKKSKK